MKEISNILITLYRISKYFHEFLKGLNNIKEFGIQEDYRIWTFLRNLKNIVTVKRFDRN